MGPVPPLVGVGREVNQSAPAVPNIHFEATYGTFVDWAKFIIPAVAFGLKAAGHIESTFTGIEGNRNRPGNGIAIVISFEAVVARAVDVDRRL